MRSNYLRRKFDPPAHRLRLSRLLSRSITYTNTICAWQFPISGLTGHPNFTVGVPGGGIAMIRWSGSEGIYVGHRAASPRCPSSTRMSPSSRISAGCLVPTPISSPRSPQRGCQSEFATRGLTLQQLGMASRLCFRHALGNSRSHDRRSNCAVPRFGSRLLEVSS